jgi:hypothetical protein
MGFKWVNSVNYRINFEKIKKTLYFCKKLHFMKYLILPFLFGAFFAQSQVTGFTVYGDLITINQDTVTYRVIEWTPILNHPKAGSCDSVTVVQVSSKPIVWKESMQAFEVNAQLRDTANEKFYVYLDKPYKFARKDPKNRFIKPVVAH